MEMTLKQAIDSVANELASDRGQAIVDAMDHAVTRLRRIREHAESLLQYSELTGSDRHAVTCIRDAANEALA